MFCNFYGIQKGNFYFKPSSLYPYFTFIFYVLIWTYLVLNFGNGLHCELSVYIRYNMWMKITRVANCPRPRLIWSRTEPIPKAKKLAQDWPAKLAHSIAGMGSSRMLSSPHPIWTKIYIFYFDFFFCMYLFFIFGPFLACQMGRICFG